MIKVRNISFSSINTLFFILILLNTILSCSNNDYQFDASGVFEATEIVISSENNGIVQRFDAEEGTILKIGQPVVQIGIVDLELQREQIDATIEALGDKRNESGPQIAILEQQLIAADANLQTLHTQLEVLVKEQTRIANLFAAKAATPQQKDDIDGKVSVMQKQIEAAETNKQVITSQINSTKRTVAIQNRAITSEKKPLEKQKSRLESQLEKATVKSPVNGTILTKYAYAGEFVNVGKPLFRLADLSEMELRAYISADQFSDIKLGQEVNVYIDKSADEYRNYSGRVTWISDEAEFTPKSIQTKNERANLVYAIKVKVANDGYIKIGMYGELDFNQGEDE